ncbi:MAG: hypothetical protein LIR46_06970 [Bacteroidota bacterium]|nr:hypothetical protein [Bacteroidota bacterium]
MKIKEIAIKSFVSESDLQDAMDYNKPGYKYDMNSMVNSIVKDRRGYKAEKWYAANKAIAIILEEDDLEDIAKYSEPERSEYKIRMNHVCKYAFKKRLIKKSQMLYSAKLNNCYDTIAEMKKGRVWKLSGDYAKDRRIILFDVNDYKQLPYSSSQQKKIEEIKSAKFMNQIIGKKIIEFAAKDGINLDIDEWDDNAPLEMHFATEMDYNKLIVKAVHNYINGLLAQLGAKVDFPEVKNIHYNWIRRICKLSEIKPIEIKGGKDGIQSESN